MTDPDLHTHVKRLRERHREPITQTNPAGVTCVSYTEHPGLIQQLRDAVHGSFGSRGAASLGAERIPINVNALNLYEELKHDIAAEYKDATGREPGRDDTPERLLAQWALAIVNGIRSGTLPEGSDEVAADLAQTWVLQIEDLFNPPKQLELTVERERETVTYRRVVKHTTGEAREERVVTTSTYRIPAPCPRCGERYGSLSTGDRVLALLLEYWELGALTFGRLRATCRACGWEWHGEDAARRLMVAIDEKDRELREADDTPEPSESARIYAQS